MGIGKKIIGTTDKITRKIKRGDPQVVVVTQVPRKKPPKKPNINPETGKRRYRRNANAGRKPILETQPAVLLKLEECFELDYTIDDACFTAGISIHTFQRYLAKHPEYRTRMASLRASITRRAKKSVYEAVPEDPKLALDVLARKIPDEYGVKNKTEITIIDEIRGMSEDSVMQRIENLMRQHAGVLEASGMVIQLPETTTTINDEDADG